MSDNYIIAGDELFLRQKSEKKLKEKFLPEDGSDLNFSIHPPEEYKAALEAVGTSPFLSDKRVAVVRDIDGLKDEDIAVITRYLEKPSTTGVLILTCSSNFKKKAIYKKILKLSTELQADPYTPYKVKESIKAFFKSRNILISPEAVELLFELKGSDPISIINELEKLAAYSGGEKIEIEHVHELVGRTVREAVYSLIKAIEKKNGQKAFRILEDLRAQKKSAHETLGYLGWHIRAIQKVKFLSQQGAGMDEMVAAIGKSAYRKSSEVRDYSASKIKEWLDAILETDRDIKQGRKEAFLALEMLVVKLSRIA